MDRYLPADANGSRFQRYHSSFKRSPMIFSVVTPCGLLQGRNSGRGTRGEGEQAGRVARKDVGWTGGRNPAPIDGPDRGEPHRPRLRVPALRLFIRLTTI